MHKYKYTASRAFKDLGTIDRMHEHGRITKHEHDVRSKRVLKRLMRTRM